MKTKWKFMYQTKNFRFEKSVKYEVSGDFTKPNGKPAPCFVSKFECEIVPDETPHKKDVDQTGKLYVLLNGEPDETKEFANWFAFDFCTKISFDHGQMDLLIGLVTWEQIPETDTEKEMIGDKPFGAEMHLVEYIEPKTFDSKTISSVNLNPEQTRLMVQFNEARRARTPIDKYLGLFQIIEYIYSEYKGNTKLEYALKASEDFKMDIAKEISRFNEGKILSEEAYSMLVRELISNRDKCAHLKRKFGYSHCDKESTDIIEPMIPLLESVTQAAIGRL